MYIRIKTVGIDKAIINGYILDKLGRFHQVCFKMALQFTLDGADRPTAAADVHLLSTRLLRPTT